MIQQDPGLPENLQQEVQDRFAVLKQQLQEAGYELLLRKPPSTDLVAFDFGLMFSRGSNQVQVYVDDDLQDVINYLLETNKQVIIKTNWLSPDVIAIQVPLDPDNFVPIDIEDNAAVTSPDGSPATETTLPMS